MNNKIITDQAILTVPCETIFEKEYDEVFDRLEDILTDTPNGIGLAAPQIGINKRAFIIGKFAEYGFLRFANPIIIEYLGLSYPSIEGCLSIPGKTFEVDRHNSICVIDDINGIQKLHAQLAQVFQHEYDHTKGLTLLQTGRLIENF